MNVSEPLSIASQFTWLQVLSERKPFKMYDNKYNWKFEMDKSTNFENVSLYEDIDQLYSFRKLKNVP